MEVLFIDDESSILQQGKLFLEKERDELTIETAPSAEEALELLNNKELEAIISDYQMPGKSGLDLLKTVRKDMNNDIPFIIFTGKGREEVAVKALNLGADRYIQKGADPKSQYNVLAQAVIDEIDHWYKIKELQKYEKMIKTVDFPIMFQDLEGKYRLINEAVSNYLEESKEEIIGKTESDFMELLSTEIISEKKKKVMEEEKSLTYKVRVLINDNEYYFETRRYPFYNRNNELKGTVAFCHDITERENLKNKVEN